MKDRLFPLLLGALLVAALVPAALLYWPAASIADGGSYCFYDDGTPYHYSGAYCPEVAEPVPAAPAPAATSRPSSTPPATINRPPATPERPAPAITAGASPTMPAGDPMFLEDSRLSKNWAAMTLAASLIPAAPGPGVGLDLGIVAVDGAEAVGLTLSKAYPRTLFAASLTKSGHEEKLWLVGRFNIW